MTHHLLVKFLLVASEKKLESGIEIVDIGGIVDITVFLF
jgi:hypothetical protein